MESTPETSEAEVAQPVLEETESASPPSEETTEESETETVVEEPSAPPPNRLKIEALRRLKALERRGKTVGTHLDELRELLTVLFKLLPD